MLTFILLVVLAGGVGVVAVSVAERPDPATPRVRNRGAARADRRSGTPSSRLGRGRSRRGSVPPSLTAVEGSYAAVAGASPLRRLVSAVTIVVIVVAVAAAIAAAFGLVAVAVGHALDSAIG